MTEDAGNGLPGLHRVQIWLNDPGNWSGSEGMLARLGEHIEYTAVIIALAVLVAVPLGTAIGSTGRGTVAAAAAANALRAVPTLGLLVLLIVVVSPRVSIGAGIPGIIPSGGIPYFLPALLVLLILAVPPILTSTYAGIQAIDPAVRDAARGSGMTALHAAIRIELPCAIPVVMSGIRSATLQVIANLTVAAYAPLVGGLGRFIVDGDQNLSDPRFGYPAMIAAGLGIAALVVATDGALKALQRQISSPGIRIRPSKRPS